MQYLPEFLIVAGVHLLAVMSPGPDFAMICRNTLMYSRRAGVFTAIGFGLGVAVHMTYSLLGISLLIAESPRLFMVMKYAGAAYLIFIGLLSLRQARLRRLSHIVASKKDLTPFQAVRIGFLTNGLNPKAALFFLSIFTQVIDPKTPAWVLFLYGIWMMGVTTTWFSGLAYMMSHHRVQHHFMRVQYRLSQVLGIALLALGIKVALR